MIEGQRVKHVTQRWTGTVVVACPDGVSVQPDNGAKPLWFPADQLVDAAKEINWVMPRH